MDALRLLMATMDEIKRLGQENERLRTALRAVYDRYCVGEDGWSIEPECHTLAREALAETVAELMAYRERKRK